MLRLILPAVNTSSTTTFRTFSLSLDVGFLRFFPQVFVVLSTLCAIVVADFLTAFELLVDCRHALLHLKTTNLAVRGISFSDAYVQFAVSDTEHENSFRQILGKYARLTRPPHDGPHHIRTTDPPVYSRPISLATARFAATYAEFERMLQMGIIHQSESPCFSPRQFLPKADTGDWQPCGDYKDLNNVTLPDRYLVPHLQYCTTYPFGMSVYSNIDLVLAFH
nr:unnamed protein product [Spirometra erinaceieuropaei]